MAKKEEPKRKEKQEEIEEAEESEESEEWLKSSCLIFIFYLYFRNCLPNSVIE